MQLKRVLSLAVLATVLILVVHYGNNCKRILEITTHQKFLVPSEVMLPAEKKDSPVQTGKEVLTSKAGIQSILEARNNISCCDIASQHKLEELCSTDEEISDFGGGNCNCSDFLMCKLVVVTALSDNHFGESIDFFASVYAKLPEVKIIVYNLGLSPKKLNSIRSYCNVKEIRKFNFANYPDHTKDLFAYAWKPFLIDMISKEYELFLYCDASCRITDMFAPFIPYILKFPILPLKSMNNLLIFRTTHSDTLEYFKLNKTRIELSKLLPEGYQAGVILVWANKVFKEKILQPWVDCAEHANCIAPKGTSRYGCNETKPLNDYMGCHRYDQSALNIILVKEFGGTLDKFFNGKDGIPNKIVIIIKHGKTYHHRNAVSQRCNIRY